MEIPLYGNSQPVGSVYELPRGPWQHEECMCGKVAFLGSRGPKTQEGRSTLTGAAVRPCVPRNIIRKNTYCCAYVCNKMTERPHVYVNRRNYIGEALTVTNRLL